ncbi:MAG: HlyD family efflux transporter periplasmic adaptor subunit [Epsilonproteobacteria bacterium]|nr:HlyD family efflux transporter periplasmic adaptor subunit [Campylobacterota bacterium]
MKKIILGVMLLLQTLYAQKIYATFDVYAKESANLAFTASGRIKKVYASIGDEVKKNQILAQLDNNDIKALLDQARVVYKYAKKEFQRQSKVKNLIDASRFDKIAKAYESAKAALAYQEAMYEKTFLKAPFDGVVFFKDIETGDAVSGMMLKTVYKVQSKNARKLLLYFDQKYAKDVKAGDLFEYKVDGDDSVYKAKILKVYPQVDPKNRKITAEVLTDGLKVGLFGTGYIYTGK